ncbi:hypothetical protein DFH07DRAFT_1008729 [Mycena maculata]|uniref:Uncharacterized protein n=1 Tax=Mycena maculata TaxID=230809 RepID=A0AAD7JN26_9AGAR|nr:hypothetical protein DFH07DRAFT_1008729 [Mycena maculata]
MAKRKRSHRRVQRVVSSSSSSSESDDDERRSSDSESSDRSPSPQLGPDATQEALYRALRKQQKLVNEAKGEAKRVRRKLADVTNASKPHKGRKKQKKDHVRLAADSELEEARVLGRKFAVTKMLWLRDKKHVFTTEVDDTYNSLE